MPPIVKYSLYVVIAFVAFDLSLYYLCVCLGLFFVIYIENEQHVISDRQLSALIYRYSDASFFYHFIALCLLFISNYFTHTIQTATSALLHVFAIHIALHSVFKLLEVDKHVGSNKSKWAANIEQRFDFNKPVVPLSIFFVLLAGLILVPNPPYFSDDGLFLDKSGVAVSESQYYLYISWLGMYVSLFSYAILAFNAASYRR